MEKRILIVEDQADIHQLLGLTLSNEGYGVHSAYDGFEALEQARANDFDLIVLDLMLPKLSGLEVCQRLRQERQHTPILMLTAKKTETDRVVGLQLGADDYLTKPFSVRELLARIHAQLRRVAFQNECSARSSDQLNFGELTIDRARRCVVRGEQTITLTVKEFELLNHLASAPGTVFSRDQLLEQVWGYQYSGYEHTVNSHINRLRSKLESNPASPEFVLTVWGVGYKFSEAV